MITFVIFEVTAELLSSTIFKWSMSENTNLETKQIGDSVNIETDIIGKYIVRFISESDNYEDISSTLIKTLNNLGLS